MKENTRRQKKFLSWTGPNKDKKQQKDRENFSLSDSRAVGPPPGKEPRDTGKWKERSWREIMSEPSAANKVSAAEPPRAPSLISSHGLWGTRVFRLLICCSLLAARVLRGEVVTVADWFNEGKHFGVFGMTLYLWIKSRRSAHQTPRAQNAPRTHTVRTVPVIHVEWIQTKSTFVYKLCDQGRPESYLFMQCVSAMKMKAWSLGLKCGSFLLSEVIVIRSNKPSKTFWYNVIITLPLMNWGFRTGWYYLCAVSTNKLMEIHASHINTCSQDTQCCITCTYLK